MRANWKYVLAAAALLMLPAIAIGVATYLRPDLILSVVDSRVAAEFEHMYGPAAKSIGHARDSGNDWSMFGFYIMNNIGIAFQCYVTGVLFALGSVFFLFWNGVYMGSIAGYVTARGFGNTFFSFIVTHSAFELTAIALCGAAGLRVGRSILFPGRMTRLDVDANRGARHQLHRVRIRCDAGHCRSLRSVLVLRHLGDAHSEVRLCCGRAGSWWALLLSAAPCRLIR